MPDTGGKVQDASRAKRRSRSIGDAEIQDTICKKATALNQLRGELERQNLKELTQSAISG